MTTQAQRSATRAHRPIYAGLVAPARRVAAWIARCHARHAQRAVLAELDDHRLHDIGLTRNEARREFEKPFWRA